MNEQKIKALEESIYEAKRFIKKSDMAIARMKGDKWNPSYTKEMGSAKRASMDLTRSLVAVRNPNN